MAIFKRKKKTGSTESIQLFKDYNLPLTPFGENISKSDVVKIAVDRIASQCSKLKPRYIKKLNDKTVTEKTGGLSFILQHKPNELMTTSQFIYKVITMLMLHDNAFIYLMFDKQSLKLKGLYPLNPVMVEPVVDDRGNHFLNFTFDNGSIGMIPYENIIHLKKFYHHDQFFGGNHSKGDHEALLKTIQINENVLQGIDNAIKSSMQIKGLLKMNAMLNETDKNKQLDSFNELLRDSVKNKGSSIIPIDLKADYIPISTDAKLIDKDTLEFLQNKIIDLLWCLSSNI